MKAFMANEEPIALAATRAVAEAGNEVKGTARAAIAAAGFSRRWQNAMRVDAYPKGNQTSINAAAHVYHKIHYAWVFEEGATLQGQPNLWMPLGHVAQKVGRNRLTAKNYPGKLQYVSRTGRPPLLVARVRVSKAMARRGQLKKLSVAQMRRGTSGGSGVIMSVPVFVGMSSVKLQRQFSISRIVTGAVDRLGTLYLKHLDVD